MNRRADPRCEHLIAYWSAIYRFEQAGRLRTLTFAGPEWAARGVTAPDLPQRWGIITAYNPLSRQLDAAENERRGQKFVAALNDRGWTHNASVNAAPDGSWPEPGRVVWGVERGELLTLARRFGQRAVVWASDGQVGLLEAASERWMVRGAHLT